MSRGKKEYRSYFEETVAEDLISRGIDPKYEQSKIEYTVPVTKHRYTPDFQLPSGIYVEVKGRFDLEDRKKMKLIIDMNPHLDIRMLFQNANQRISKTSKTTYASWCDKNNIKWAQGKVPESWINCEASSS